ncbi:MAG: hypothetical protein JXQ90_18310 [Cyclobacteriaceae bacterium]
MSNLLTRNQLAYMLGQDSFNSATDQQLLFPLQQGEQSLQHANSKSI